jgi:Flp pilus assembly protein TadG
MIWARRRHRHSRRGAGQALVEFALALPPFLLIVCGMLDTGRAVYYQSTLTNAARAALRVAIVDQNMTRINNMLVSEGVALPLAPSDIDYIGYKVSDDPALGTAHPETAENCAPIAVGCIAVIKVHYMWTPITPVVGSMMGPIVLTTSTEMPIEEKYTSP